ncbi:MAG: RHS repeat protein [Bacteriovorax sp.]|nr:RHS repeat protein [Bacteriovorax sp.]
MIKYDPINGNILSIKQHPSTGAELITRMNYNERGEIISVIDPKQNALTIARAINTDKSERITLTDAEGGIQTRELDPLGQVVASKDANGIESTFAYNTLGNIVSSSTPQAAIGQSFAYDKSNNLISVGRNVDGKNTYNKLQARRTW